MRKKIVARRIVYNAIEKFAEKVKAENPLEAFEQALENAKPALEVKSRRIGGATYQVPIEIPPIDAFQWLCAGSSLSREKRRPLHGRWSCTGTSRLLSTIKVRQSRKKTILTAWQKLTKHLPTTSGNRREVNVWQDPKTEI